MHADACMRSSRSTADHADTRCPRQLSMCLRHVCRGALVPANDESDLILRVAERVKHRKKALARNAEDRVQSLNAQSIYEQFGACSRWIIARSHPILCLDPRKKITIVFVATVVLQLIFVASSRVALCAVISGKAQAVETVSSN